MKQFTERIMKVVSSNTDAIFDFIPLLDGNIKDYENRFKESIKNYDAYLTNKEKTDYLNNPSYKLYKIKNRKSSTDSIVAKVKWKFDLNGKYKKAKEVSVYVGNLIKYPNGVNDDNIPKEINEILKSYFEKSSPLIPINNADYEQHKSDIKLYYYWKNKLDEIKYREKPVYYLSILKKESKYDAIIANIKWGLPVKGKSKSPNYLTTYLGSLKKYPKGIEDTNLKNDINLLLKKYINKVSPIEITPILD